jgi:uncharacterized membrane protein YbhN (UPF0104 family)
MVFKGDADGHSFVRFSAFGAMRTHSRDPFFARYRAQLERGQFLVLTLCLGLFFLAASALLFVLFQSVFPSVYVLGGAGFFMILSFAVVLPMTNRRGRYRTRKAR